MLTVENKDRFYKTLDIARAFVELSNTEDAVRTLHMAINEIEDANDENSKYFIIVNGQYHNVKDVVRSYIGGSMSKVEAIKIIHSRTHSGTAQAAEFLTDARFGK